MFARDPEALAKYQASGTGPAMLANRLSWFYNLHGPSIALDTACSSSMNALYLAVQNLRSSETNLACGPPLLFNVNPALTKAWYLGYCRRMQPNSQPRLCYGPFSQPEFSFP